MKKLKLILILFCFITNLSFWGCDEDLETPDACYTLWITVEGEQVELTAPYTIEAGQEIAFSNCGDADFYSFFSGLGGESWAEFNDPANATVTGSDTDPSGNVDCTYSEPGQYVATIVLINRSIEDPTNYKQEVINFDITVTEVTE